MFYDSHVHCIGSEKGGFLIGLEGEPKYRNTISNDEVLIKHNIQNKYVAFYYVTKGNINKKLIHPYLKFHPKREQYSPKEVIDSIRLNKPRAIIIDTLNEPFWGAYDYWSVAREFTNLPMVFAHAGGYLINEFVKICNFQKNVWIDFSLTHCVLGKYGDEKGLNYVNDAIKFALNSHFKERILMGSDYPFYCQEDVVKYYSNHINLLNHNFEALLKIIS